MILWERVPTAPTFPIVEEQTLRRVGLYRVLSQINGDYKITTAMRRRL